VVALAALGIRALVHLDPSYDTFSYHLPFAAQRVGIATSFDMRPDFRQAFEGFPPLADIAQGALWKAFGTVTAVQLVNYGALVGFLAYCDRLLHARFWVVALISLSAPLIVIHATVGYIDLFTNVFLAIGISSALFLLLFPERATRAVFVGGLLGLVAACWTKYTVVPLGGPVFIAYLLLGLGAGRPSRLDRRQAVLLVIGAIALAAIPYVRNLIVFGNPFWPVRVPFVGGLFPYASDPEASGIALNRPPYLIDAPQWAVFVRSLFEVNVPIQYEFRPRWTIDQWAGWPGTISGMRMGGFWNVGVAVFLGAMLAGLAVFRGRRGLVAIGATVFVLLLTAYLPQSNELRYFLFIPLVWAATLGMLLPGLADRWPAAAAAAIAAVLVLFGLMAWTNRSYYKAPPSGWADVAANLGAAVWWSKLSPGQPYCAVGFTRTAFLMTGPTMSEFSIYSRETGRTCPPGTTRIIAEGVQPED
jgi:MFS family permease